jgi:hypothetical protein
MAVNSPIVVPDASSMVWMSLRSVWRAVLSAVFEVEDDVPVVLSVLVLVEAVEAVDVEPVVPEVCTLAAWWA